MPPPPSHDPRSTRTSARYAALALVPFLAGTWVGLSRHDAEATRDMTAPPPNVADVAPARDDLPAPEPRAEVSPAPVDPAALPDPTPWPRLNPEQSLHRAWLLAEGPARTSATRRHLVTFTFDDGPFPETTPAVLDVLARYKVHATFFWIGRYLDGDDDRAVTTRAVARRVALEGHTIGNHTHDHRPLATLSNAEALAQIDGGASSIERVVGRRPVFFRPPYGSLDAFASGALRSRGDELVLWSVEGSDMHRHDPEAIAEDLRVQLAFARGGIVLLHDIRSATVPVLETLLKWLRARRYDPSRPEREGYDVVDLPTYLRETGDAPQPYESRAELERARALAWRRAHPHTTHAAPPTHDATEAGEEGSDPVITSASLTASTTTAGNVLAASRQPPIESQIAAARAPVGSRRLSTSRGQ